MSHDIPELLRAVYAAAFALELQRIRACGEAINEAALKHARDEARKVARWAEEAEGLEEA